MNILYLTLLTMENIDERGLHTDLIKELAIRHHIYVVSPREKRTNLPTEVTTKGNIRILKVKTGNLTETANLIEKGMSTLLIEGQYLNSIKKYYKDIHFDMVMYSTPPITFGKIVGYFKKKHNSKSYLILKDIFPQNAADIGAIKKNGLIWNYFRIKEKKLYEISDRIGCMSQANVEYVLSHNPNIDKDIVEVFPNSIKPINRIERKAKNKDLLRKYNIPENSTVFVYGGNLGRPQGIDFLIDVIKNFNLVETSYLLIVGSGTEYNKIKNYIDSLRPRNVSLYNKLPKDEYDQLLNIADVGLIFLDRRFTIPNFPSRITAYMESSLPILAATDRHTDIKDVIIKSGCGLWSESGEINSFIRNVRKLSSDSDLRNSMGFRGRKYLEDNYDVTKTINIIMKHL